jgi:hypothetical protein
MSAADIQTALDFGDPRAVADLRTFLARARAVEDGAVRFQAVGGVLAVYVCVLSPRVLGEATPTVLGLRTVALARPAELDATVAIASVFDRFARLGEDATLLDVPSSHIRTPWAAVSPPRGPWRPLGRLDGQQIAAAAAAGIAEVAGAVPDRPGSAVVHGVRAAVWGRDLEGTPGVPAGAAFAAHTLGFAAAGEPLDLFESGPWVRLSSHRGHVLCRRPSLLGM